MNHKVEKGCFIMGNFSWNLAAALPSKSDFVKVHAGIVDTDVSNLYDKVKKEQSKFNKTAEGKKAKESSKDSDKTSEK